MNNFVKKYTFFNSFSVLSFKGRLKLDFEELLAFKRWKIFNLLVKAIFLNLNQLAILKLMKDFR